MSTLNILVTQLLFILLTASIELNSLIRAQWARHVFLPSNPVRVCLSSSNTPDHALLYSRKYRVVHHAPFWVAGWAMYA